MLKALKDIEIMYDGKTAKVKAGTVFNASELFNTEIKLDAWLLSKRKDVVKAEREENVSSGANDNRRSRRASSRGRGTRHKNTSVD